MKYFTIPKLSYLIGSSEKTAQIKAMPFTIGENTRISLVQHWFGTFGSLVAGDPGNNIPPGYPKIVVDENNQPINVTPLLKHSVWRADISPGLLLEELDIKLLVNVNATISPDEKWIQIDPGDSSNFYWKLVNVPAAIAGTLTDQYFLETDVIDAPMPSPQGVTYATYGGKVSLDNKQWRLSVSNRVKVEKQFNFDTLLMSLVSHSIIRMNLNEALPPVDETNRRRVPTFNPVTGKAVYDFLMNNLALPSLDIYSNIKIGIDPAMPPASAANIKTASGFLQTNNFNFYSMFNKQVGTFDGRVGYIEDEPELSWVYRGTTSDKAYTDPTNNPNPKEQASPHVSSSTNAGGQIVPGENKATGGRLVVNNKFLQIPVPTPIHSRDYTTPPPLEATAKGVLGQTETNKGTFETSTFESSATKDHREKIKDNFATNDLVPKLVVDYMIRDIVGDLPAVRSLKRATASTAARQDIINRRIIDIDQTDPLVLKSYVDENVKDLVDSKAPINTTLVETPLQADFSETPNDSKPLTVLLQFLWNNIRWLFNDKETVQNKKTHLVDIDDNTYPTTKAVKTELDGRAPINTTLSNEDESNVLPSIERTAITTLLQTIRNNLKWLFNRKADKSNITAATKTKITYNAQGIVTAGADLAASDIPALAISKITDLQTTLNLKANKTTIAAATKTKISYNDQGIVTAGADLAASDIPALAISKITDLQTKLDSKANKTTIAAATKTKITYNDQGIVTAGADLAASDIPTLTKNKISDFPTSLPANGGTADRANQINIPDTFLTSVNNAQYISFKPGISHFRWNLYNGAKIYIRADPNPTPLPNPYHKLAYMLINMKQGSFDSSYETIFMVRDFGLDNNWFEFHGNSTAGEVYSLRMIVMLV
jgi:hypothetical protein